jgi:hypothetical protein
MLYRYFGAKGNKMPMPPQSGSVVPNVVEPLPVCRQVVIGNGTKKSMVVSCGNRIPVEQRKLKNYRRIKG